MAAHCPPLFGAVFTSYTYNNAPLAPAAGAGSGALLGQDGDRLASSAFSQPGAVLAAAVEFVPCYSVFVDEPGCPIVVILPSGAAKWKASILTSLIPRRLARQARQCSLRTHCQASIAKFFRCGCARSRHLLPPVAHITAERQRPGSVRQLVNIALSASGLASVPALNCTLVAMTAGGGECRLAQGPDSEVWGTSLEELEK